VSEVSVRACWVRLDLVKFDSTGMHLVRLGWVRRGQVQITAMRCSVCNGSSTHEVKVAGT
jgi:hypothetical protein